MLSWLAERRPRDRAAGRPGAAEAGQAQGDRHRWTSGRSRVWLRGHDRPLHGPGARGRPPLPEQGRMAARRRGPSRRVAEAKKACEILKARPFTRARSTARRSWTLHTMRHSARSWRPSSPPSFSRTGRSTTTPTTGPSRCSSTMPGCKMEKRFALYYYEVSNGEDTVQFSPTHYVDITGPSRENAACYAHASQTPDQYYALQEQVTRLRRHRERPSPSRRLHPPRAEPRLRLHSPARKFRVGIAHRFRHSPAATVKLASPKTEKGVRTRFSRLTRFSGSVAGGKNYIGESRGSVPCILSPFLTCGGNVPS